MATRVLAGRLGSVTWLCNLAARMALQLGFVSWLRKGGDVCLGMVPRLRNLAARSLSRDYFEGASSSFDRPVA